MGGAGLVDTETAWWPRMQSGSGLLLGLAVGGRGWFIGDENGGQQRQKWHSIKLK